MLHVTADKQEVVFAYDRLDISFLSKIQLRWMILLPLSGTLDKAMELRDVIRYFLLLGAVRSTEHDFVVLKTDNVLLETVIFGFEVANICLHLVFNQIGIQLFIIILNAE